MSKKKTFVTLEQLKEIDKTYPTPYHLYDEKGIRENAKRLKEASALLSFWLQSVTDVHHEEQFLLFLMVSLPLLT